MRQEPTAWREQEKQNQARLPLAAHHGAADLRVGAVAAKHKVGHDGNLLAVGPWGGGGRGLDEGSSALAREA